MIALEHCWVSIWETFLDFLSHCSNCSGSTHWVAKNGKQQIAIKIDDIEKSAENFITKLEADIYQLLIMYDLSK